MLLSYVPSILSASLSTGDSTVYSPDNETGQSLQRYLPLLIGMHLVAGILAEIPQILESTSWQESLLFF